MAFFSQSLAGKEVAAMKERTVLGTGSTRRDFIGRIVPACAVACLGLRARPLFGQVEQTGQVPAPVKHKFDEEIPRKPSYREIFAVEYASDLIPLLLFLAKDLGPAAAVEKLKAFSAERAAESAAFIAKRVGGNDFAALKKVFDPASPPYRHTLTFSVTESSDRVHALKVTECLWAKTFLEAKAGDLGYAAICYGDHAFAKAFNPQVEMVRDKTLMQGMDSCNHRYLLKV
jgi:L-2-amino-thiazoline-4-carboxylic acid hydrolase